MGRNRKPEDAWLPKRVYRGRSKYEYRPRTGGCIPLCPLDADRATVWQAYHRATAEPGPGSFKALRDAYFASPKFAKLAEETRRAYLRYSDQLLSVFGDMLADDIEPADVRAWLDARGEAKSEVLANRELALLGAIFKWGYERGKCKRRPTIGVERFSEAPRTRVVEPDEVLAFAAHAGPRLRAYLALKESTGLRQGEILALPLRALTQPDGLHVEHPSKRGQKRIIEWSPALEAARDAILALEPAARTYTWPAAGGGKLTQAGFQVEWQRTMRKHVDAGGERFHEHDLRAAAVDELPLEHAQALLGHLSAKTTRRHYKRRPTMVKPAK